MNQPVIINTLDELLKARGVTAYRAAKDLGVTNMFFTRLKRPNTVVSARNMAKLCVYFDCQPGDFIKYIPDEEIN